MLREASEKRIKLITIMAFVSIPLSGFVTDIYLPSFPSMARELSVSEKDIQITLTSYLLSYGISQLFVGGILDSIGRYRPKLLALFLLVISSLLITMTDSILLICLLRILQGVAVSVLVVATRAIFVDIYDSERVKHYLSYFTIVWSCGPILAPFLGGYLEKLFNWHANFHFLALYAGLIFLFEWFFSGESLPQKKKLDLAENISLYKMMLKNRIFMLGIFILGLSYSIVMLFNITGPFIIENTFHFTPVVIGYCTLILGFSWMIGGFIGKRRLTLDFKPRILQPILLQLTLIVALIITSNYAESLFIMVPFAFFIHICSGVLFTSFFTTSMLYFPKNAGTAGGLMGGLVYVITSISSFIISVSGTVTEQQGLAWRYLIIAFFLLGIILIMNQAIKKEKGTVSKGKITL
ncbi:Bcr/CflA subfamily drug resistance transporter [Chryseobacterium rhizosphaerae]|uniref:MFS transporter n=1 Tax=Chryseobacterium rhizosphaerae TaxID=395937 RepID=UPI00064808F5|nr:MFS transporter [Chryseobacterium rhizosphaerae]MDR6547330.1 Bcr/CflA subfamily drug resistance transporter [Chryseobacterium rhizosphaerae]